MRAAQSTANNSHWPILEFLSRPKVSTQARNSGETSWPHVWQVSEIPSYTITPTRAEVGENCASV